MGRQLSTGRTPAAAFRARHASTSTTPLASAGAGENRTGQGRPWLPAPQPHVSIDFPGSFTVLSGIFTIIAWIYAVAMSYGGNSVVASLSFACFLCSTLLGMGSTARLSAEFTREHYGYNIPLARRVFIWHRAMSGAVLLFYSGCLLMVVASAWALFDTRRTIAAVVLALSGLIALAGGAATHWHMVTHPLGVATDTIFSGPGYEFWAPGEEEEGRRRPLEEEAQAHTQGGQDHTAQNNVPLIQTGATQASTDALKPSLPAEESSHDPVPDRKVLAVFQPQLSSSSSPPPTQQQQAHSGTAGTATAPTEEASADNGNRVAQALASSTVSPESMGPLASSHGLQVHALLEQAHAHVHRASAVSTAVKGGPQGSSPLLPSGHRGSDSLQAGVRVSFRLPGGQTHTPSRDEAMPVVRTGTAARAPPPPLHIARPSSTSQLQS